MGEDWKDIPNYKGLYQISNLGRVKSLPNTDHRYKKLKIMHVKEKKSTGRLHINLCKNNQVTGFTLAELLIITFPGMDISEYDISEYDNSVKDLPNEKWEFVINTEERYKVSNLGRVKRVRCRSKWEDEWFYSEKLAVPCQNKYGYWNVCLKMSTNKFYVCLVHRLVATAFVKNPNNKRVVHHIDHNKSNNKSSNLHWTDRETNTLLAWQDGLHDGNLPCGENHVYAKTSWDDVLTIRKLYSEHVYTQTELAEIYNVSQTAIHNMVRNKSWLKKE